MELYVHPLLCVDQIHSFSYFTSIDKYLTLLTYTIFNQEFPLYQNYSYHKLTPKSTSISSLSPGEDSPLFSIGHGATSSVGVASEFQHTFWSLCVMYLVKL